MTCQAPIRISLPSVAAVMLAACQITPGLDHREVPAKVRASLDSNSRAPSSQELRGNEILIDVTIAGDGPVSMRMSSREGMPVVSARISRGGQTPFIVDTGSQGCVMEARTAVAHRVTVLDHASAYMTLGGTTGKERVLIGIPEKVAIGAWVLQRFPFFVRTHETSVRLSRWDNRDLSCDIIGMNAILKSCRYLTLDFPAKRFVFGIGKSFDPPSPKKSWKAPLLMRNGLPYVELHTNGKTWTALLDSGFNGLLDMDKATAQRLGLLDQAKPTDAFRAGLGAPVDGEPSQFGMVSLPKLDSLGPHMVNIPTLIVPQRSKIGCALLRPFRVTLDFENELLWLEK